MLELIAFTALCGVGIVIALWSIVGWWLERDEWED